MTAEAEGTRAGQMMVAQLRMAHEPLRRDVVVLRDALTTLDQATLRPQDVHELLRGLTVADLAWQLKTGCAHFCAHLDLHHTIEDTRMLPVMERTFPELASKISRLRQEHAAVTHLVVEIRQGAERLDSADEPSVRTVLDAVTELANHLQAHLDFEEDTLFPYFLTMDRDWHR